MLCIKLIGEGHRHRDASQTRSLSLKEVVKVAKCFKATTYANQLMKTTKGNQEQVNYTKPKTGKEAMHWPSTPCYCLVIGALVAINNLANSTALHTARDVINVESWAISLVLAKAGQVNKDRINSPISSKSSRAKRPLR